MTSIICVPLGAYTFSPQASQDREPVSRRTTSGLGLCENGFGKCWCGEGFPHLIELFTSCPLDRFMCPTREQSRCSHRLGFSTPDSDTYRACASSMLFSLYTRNYTEMNFTDKFVSTRGRIERETKIHRFQPKLVQ